MAVGIIPVAAAVADAFELGDPHHICVTPDLDKPLNLLAEFMKLSLLITVLYEPIPIATLKELPMTTESIMLMRIL
jgi:hypothetical protein